MERDKNRLFDFWKKENIPGRTRKRFRLVLGVVTVVLAGSQYLPSLAEDLFSNGSTQTSSSNQTSSTSPATSPSDSSDTSTVGIKEGIKEEGKAAQETSEDQGGNSSPENSDSAETSATPTPSSKPPPPPEATSTQEMYVVFPTSLRVDPRATVTFFPNVILASSNFLMVCAQSSSIKFDLGSHGQIDDVTSSSLVIEGDRTHSLVISGASSTVNSLVNSDGGLMVYSEGRGVAPQGALFRLVDITKPSSNDSLCRDGNLKNHRYVNFIPLGITQSISKGKVDLKKKN